MEELHELHGQHVTHILTGKGLAGRAVSIRGPVPDILTGLPGRVASKVLTDLPGRVASKGRYPTHLLTYLAE